MFSKFHNNNIAGRQHYHKMSKVALTHDKCRLKLCIICVNKKPSVHRIGKVVKSAVQSYLPGLDIQNDPRLPNGICDNCRNSDCIGQVPSIDLRIAQRVYSFNVFTIISRVKVA